MDPQGNALAHPLPRLTCAAVRDGPDWALEAFDDPAMDAYRDSHNDVSVSCQNVRSAPTHGLALWHRYGTARSTKHLKVFKHAYALSLDGLAMTLLPFQGPQRRA